MAVPLEFDSTWRKGQARLITRDSPMIDGLRPAVTEATERGLLRPDVTAETFAMAAIGPLFYQRRGTAGSHRAADRS